MFCGSLPCTCNAKPAKVKATRAPRPKSEVEPEQPKVDRKAAMKSAAYRDPTPAPVVQESVDDDMAAALIVLDTYDMIAPEDRDRFRDVLNNTELRARLWRERRNSA
jgi:hypothetical protein